MISEADMREYCKNQHILAVGQVEEYKPPAGVSITEAYAMERALITNYFDNQNPQELAPIAGDLELSLDECRQMIDGVAKHTAGKFAAFLTGQPYEVKKANEGTIPAENGPGATNFMLDL